MTRTQELYQKLWDSADILRSKMDANEYKSYLLGLIFYKFLSDNMVLKAADLIGEETEDIDEAQMIFESYMEEGTLEDRQELLDELKYEYSFNLKAELTFGALIKEIKNKSFQLEDLQQGFRDLEQSDPAYENLFEDIDLYSKKLGQTPQKQNETISKIMLTLAPLNFAKTKGDVLGDAYEYLIGQFASESGKKAGEFYTPQSVSHLMTRIAIDGKENKKGLSAYDPTMGSGSLLLNAKKYSNETKTINYFGQELNTSTFNLARMNMILHRVPIENQHLRNGDTLDADWPVDEPTNFDMVLMNPPYSAKWSAHKGFLDDQRFAPFGVLAPKSSADLAFLLHGFYHLKNDGVMAIVLPHGPLFRGGSEGKIRQKLLENGNIDTIIGLPANIFFNTSIPTIIMVLKKNKEDRSVLFIDGSNDFEKVKTQNILRDDHIEKIIQTYRKRDTIEKYSYLADFKEIEENEFNLNIPRYVDTFEEEEEIPLAEVSKSLRVTQADLKAAEDELKNLLKDLVGTSDSAQEDLDSFLQGLLGE